MKSISFVCACKKKKSTRGLVLFHINNDIRYRSLIVKFSYEQELQFLEKTIVFILKTI